MADVEKVGDALQETTVTEPKKEPKKKTKKASSQSFGNDEVTEKVYLIFSGFAKISGRENTFKQKDFEQEGRALVRMADKFSVITHIITLFDPVVFVLGLFTKFSGLAKKKKETKAQEEPQNV